MTNTDTVRADLHTYGGRTSNKFHSEDFFYLNQAATSRLGQTGVVGIADVDERRWSKLKKIAQEDDHYSINDIGNAFITAAVTTYIRGERVFVKYDKYAEILGLEEDESKKPNGSFLVLGLKEDEHIPGGTEIREAIHRAYEYGGTIILSNFSEGNSVTQFAGESPEFLRYVDAIEAHNGSSAYLPFVNTRVRNPIDGTTKTKNEQAQAAYDACRNVFGFPNLGALVASGAHSFGEIGTSWMEIPALDTTNADTLKESLKAAVRGRESGSSDEQRVDSHWGAFSHAVKLVPWMFYGAKRREVVNGIAQ